jgi:hypothetical protein
MPETKPKNMYARIFREIFYEQNERNIQSLVNCYSYACQRISDAGTMEDLKAVTDEYHLIISEGF